MYSCHFHFNSYCNLWSREILLYPPSSIKSNKKTAHKRTYYPLHPRLLACRYHLNLPYHLISTYPDTDRVYRQKHRQFIFVDQSTWNIINGDWRVITAKLLCNCLLKSFIGFCVKIRPRLDDAISWRAPNTDANIDVNGNLNKINS
jgi:hypothetical protein